MSRSRTFSPLRMRRYRWQYRRIIAQLFLDHFDGAVELLIGTGEFLGGVVVHDDVGIDAVTFDDPFLAVDLVGGELRLVDIAAVKQRQSAADADGAAPASLADQLAELVMAEAIGEEIAVGGGELVEEADLRTHHD